ncbi:MAG: coenzyme F420-0:L-glutamate ligase [Actinomycetota bacterium]
MNKTPIIIFPLEGMKEVTSGDQLAPMITQAAEIACDGFTHGDVVVVTSKIISKAEGRVVVLASDDDAAKLSLVMAESSRIVRRRKGLIITETKHGFVCANAGIDMSNIEDGHAVLLPLDPDLSARRLRIELQRLTGTEVAVIISDTFGRAWRIGQTDVAIGVAGMLATKEHKGTLDHMGRDLKVTNIAVADELAGAAELVMGKADKIPVAVIRGYQTIPGRGNAASMVRPADEDLFR